MNAAGENERNLLVSNGSDWGCNAIENGGNARNYGWRTLTVNEWKYLLNTRKVKGKTGFGKTCVWTTLDNTIKGLIIFPDDYMGETTGLTSIPDGCVFLPAAGERGGTSVSQVGSRGRYCSPSYLNSSNVYTLYFTSGNLTPDNGDASRGTGISVRLVSDK